VLQVGEMYKYTVPVFSTELGKVKFTVKNDLVVCDGFIHDCLLLWS